MSKARGYSPSEPNEPRLLDLKAAACYLGIPFWTMRDLVVSGAVQRVLLPGRDGRPQRRLWVERRDLDQFIDRSKEANVPGVLTIDVSTRCANARVRGARGRSRSIE